MSTPGQAPAWRGRVRHDPVLRARLLRVAAWAGVACATLAVFALYRQPGFLKTLADQIWACF